MTSRRKFVQAAIGAPVILGAQDKTGSQRPVIGSGEFQYEVFHDWGELPSNIKYGKTHGVCRDSQGHIYVHHTVHKTSQSPDAMVVFDDKGKFVKSWGGEYREGAHGLHLRKEGSTEYLYLCDINRHIMLKTTLGGEPVFTIGYPNDSPQYNQKKITYTPTNVAIAPNGDIYVADGYGSSYVNQYNSQGKYIRTFGGLGTEAGQLNNPHGIWMDTRGPEPIVTVADRRNYRLQTFTTEGKHINFIPGLRYPSHFDGRGEFMLVPELEARVSILNGKNQIVAHFGQGPDNFREVRLLDRSAFVPGQFVAPHSACFDQDGNIFVVEWVEVGRVTKLRKVA
jgi:hypothetical protein